MIKLCASAYVYSSVATPLFIALWQCPKVTTISNMIVHFSGTRLMALWYTQYTWRKFTKPVSFSLVTVYFSSRTWDQHSSLSVFPPCLHLRVFFFSFFHSCFPACSVSSFNCMFFEKQAFGSVEIQVLVLPTEVVVMPLGYSEWPKGLLPRGQSKQTVVLLMLSHM